MIAQILLTMNLPNFASNCYINFDKIYCTALCKPCVVSYFTQSNLKSQIVSSIANKFNFTRIYADTVPSGEFYYETNDFSQSEHSGTHLDAPSHFAKGRWRTGQIPLARLAGPAVVVSIEEKAREV